MKVTSFLIFFLLFGNLFAQPDSAQHMPPLEMLQSKDGEEVNIMELPGEFEYTVFNSNGEKVEDGYGRFIDYTEYEPGRYFVHFDGQSITFEKKPAPYDVKKAQTMLYVALGCIILFILVIIVLIRKVKRERSRLLEQIEAIKNDASSSSESLTQSNQVALDKSAIEQRADAKLNESDWKIIYSIMELPSISNKELANQVALSVEGTRSSLKKMYRLFEIPSSRNMRLTLVLKLSQISNQKDA